MEAIRFGPRLDNYGCLVKMVSIDHLEELRNDIEQHHHQGRLDENFYQESLSGFRFEKPADLPNVSSILVVAKPQPALSVLVHWKGREVPLIVPPTYADAPIVDGHALAALNNMLMPGPYHYTKARLPLKTLAARSGLVKYGKNNITYIPKLGSFHRLTAFFSDAPCLEDQWQEMEMLPGCSGCSACQKACPTGAIPEDRFLLRAERCLTYLNEKDAAHPFPEWVDPMAHNALVGCMSCQRACPYNNAVLYWSVDRGTLSEKETSLLLSAQRSGKEVKHLEERLKGMGLDLSTFPRNLAVILDNIVDD